MNREQLLALADSRHPAALAFAQKLVQTPSLPGEEGELAKLVSGEMKRQGYDDVWQDRAGNIIGVMKGRRPGKTLMLNSHMDHVDTGELSAWAVPPYSGEIRDGAIWGRGTCDLKCSLSVQVCAVAALRQAGVPFAGDIYVTAVVFEEKGGGLGTRCVLRELCPNYAILGEPSGNQLMRGHRGRIELVARVQGRAAHASMPSEAVNPHYSLANFLSKLRTLPLPGDSQFGTSTLAPTRYYTEQGGGNVIPGEASVHIDYRSIPSESVDHVIGTLQTVLDGSLIPNSQGDIHVLQIPLRTYAGHDEEVLSVNPAYELSERHPFVWNCRRILEQTLGQTVKTTMLPFVSDGGYFVERGIPAVSFAPGEPRLAHTSQEHVRLDQMRQALAGYIALAEELGEIN